jgi:hypothetical protein
VKGGGEGSPVSVPWSGHFSWMGQVQCGPSPVAQCHLFFSIGFNSIQIQTSEIHRNLIIFEQNINLISYFKFKLH